MSTALITAAGAAASAEFELPAGVSANVGLENHDNIAVVAIELKNSLNGWAEAGRLDANAAICWRIDGPGIFRLNRIRGQAGAFRA